MVWGSDLVVTATALTLINLLGAGGVMIAYGLMNVLAFVFTWYYPGARARPARVGARTTA